MTSLLTKKYVPKTEAYRKIPQHYNRKNWLDSGSEKWRNTARNVYIKNRRIKSPVSSYSRKAEYYQTDPYEQKVITGTSEIDHTVSIREAFGSGGHSWSKEKKNKFSHDTANLLPLMKATNRAKGASDITGWKPKYNQESMALTQERIKKKWDLSADPAEFKALSKVLGRKPDLKIKPKVENTMVCMQCHANRPYKNKP